MEAKVHKNKENKIRIVADIVSQHYEPERQDRSLVWCYRNVVNKLYPMSERTFRRYIKYATDHLGYTFAEKDEDYYLDDVFSKMKPETIERIKEVADELENIGTQGKTKLCAYDELIENRGWELHKSNYFKYLNIAETYLGYNFKFQ